MKKTALENSNNSGIIRRPIEAATNSGDFDTQYLVHIGRYDKCASLMMKMSEEFGRPIRIVNLCCGEMWDLRVLNSAYFSKKSDIIESYVGIDIEDQKCPVGDKVMKDIGYKFIAKDLTIDCKIPESDNSVDLVIFTEGIEHMDKIYVQPILKEIYRVMHKNSILYISTPNGGMRKMDAWHRYEYPIGEFYAMMEHNSFIVESAVGLFISKRNYAKAVKEYGERYFSKEAIQSFSNRFGEYWIKIMLATPYPEFSDDVAYICRKGI